jgi:hypothetical protein
MTFEFTSYLTGNKLRLRYENQPVNAVWVNNRCENHAEHVNTLCVCGGGGVQRFCNVGRLMDNMAWLQMVLKTLHFAHRVNLCISYDFQKKQALFP